MRMACASLAAVPAVTDALPMAAAMDPLADPALADDDDIEFLTLDKVKVERLEPSLTARIDGVEMDFWSVIIRGDSHLVGSPSLLSPSLDMPRCFVGNAGINWADQVSQSNKKKKNKQKIEGNPSKSQR